MKFPGTPRPPESVRLDVRIEPAALAAAPAGASVAARVARFHTDVATRISEGTWSVLHTLGAHRWREGYETDSDRGMSRYRGSRCTICDDPWEGW
jgi:hypothetical protein